MTEHSPAPAGGPASSQDSPEQIFKLPEHLDMSDSQDSDTAAVSPSRDLVTDQTISTGQRPRWSIKQAAKECGVSDRTITRRINDLQTHGAAKDEDGHWLIPVEALQAVGFQPGKPTPPDDVSHRQSDSAESLSAGHDSPGLGTVVLSVEDLIDLREQVATLKGERDAAKAEAKGLELALSATQTALRVLEAAPPAHVQHPPQQMPTTEPAAAWHQGSGTVEPIERRWWGGKKKRQ